MKPKGIFNRSEPEGRRLFSLFPPVLQVVGRRVDISMQEEWGQRPPRTQLVAIGAQGAVDGEAPRERFAGCIATPGRN